MRIFAAIIVLFGLSIFCDAQGGKTKADEILKEVREAAFKKNDALSIGYLEAATTLNVRKSKISSGVIPSFEFKSKLWQQRNDGIRIRKLITYPGNSLELSEKIFFAQKLKTSIKIKSPTDAGFVAAGFTEPGDAKQNEENAIKKLRYEAFCLGFPVFLFSSENLVFDYVGVAKSGEQKTDVISTSLADIYKIRLFFDQKTHQLLLMTANFTDPKTKEEIEHKYFFSDYEQVNGVTCAHKIIMHENGEIVEERDIKQIELNPKVETDFFNTTK